MPRRKVCLTELKFSWYQKTSGYKQTRSTFQVKVEDSCVSLLFLCVYSVHQIHCTVQYCTVYLVHTVRSVQSPGAVPCVYVVYTVYSTGVCSVLCSALVHVRTVHAQWAAQCMIGANTLSHFD